jgi:GAF domain-containing protein
MTPQNTQPSFDPSNLPEAGGSSPQVKLRQAAEPVSQALKSDRSVDQIVRLLRRRLQADRVLLYYFYTEWAGQVTFEALESSTSSILGCRGPDECFNAEYAAQYQAGRVRAITDIELEPIQDCHREFLRRLRVRANLVVPVLTQTGLWGLLVAHHCRSARPWSLTDVDIMQEEATKLAQANALQLV